MRTICEEPWFAEIATRLFGPPQHSDARLESVKWVLAHDRDLSRYQQIDQADVGIIRVMKTQPLGAFHSVTVHFAVSEDDHCVFLRDIYNHPSPGAVPMPLKPLIPSLKAPVRPIKR